MDLVAFACLCTAGVLMAIVLRALLFSRLLAHHMFVAGFAIFGFLDAWKYHTYERHLRGDFGESVFLVVAFGFFVAFALYLIVYQVISAKTPAASRMYAAKRGASMQPRGLVIGVLGIVPVSLVPDQSSYGTMANCFVVGYWLGLCTSFIAARRPLATFVSVAIAVLVLLIHGYTSRRIVVSCIVPLLLVVNRLAQTGGGRQWNRARWVIAVTIPTAFVMLNAMRAGHDFGYGYQPGAVVSNTVNYIASLRSIDTFWNTCYIATNFPSRFSLYYGETYAAILVALIPREVWLGKPVGLAAPLGIMQKFGVQAPFDAGIWTEANFYSLSPGLLGEAYANFGVFGVLLVPPILGILVAWLDRRIDGCDLASVSRYGCLAAACLLLHRGDTYSALLYPLFLFAGITMYDIVRGRNDGHS